MTYLPHKTMPALYLQSLLYPDKMGRALQVARKKVLETFKGSSIKSLNRKPKEK